MTANIDELLETLDEINDPCSEAYGYDLGLVEMGLIDASCIDCTGDEVDLTVRLTSPSCEMSHYIASEIEKKLHGAGVTDFHISYDYGLEWQPELMSDDAQEKIGSF